MRFLRLIWSCILLVSPQLRRVPPSRGRLQVSVQESLDCVRSRSLILHCSSPLIHPRVLACLHVRAVCAPPAAAAAVAAHRSCSSAALVSLASAAHAVVSPLHSNSWSDTVRLQGPHCHKERQRWSFRTGRRFASCLRGGGRGKFSAGRRCAGAGCRFTSRTATSLRYQEGKERCGHTFPPPGGSRHLDVDWALGNRWAGRRCVKPHIREFGCSRATPELVCFPTILITFGWDGGLGDHTRPPGLRQGTTVCVHTSMDMEQQSDHKLRRHTGRAYWFVGHPSCRPGVQESENSPELTVSMSSGHSVEFQVRRASWEAPSSITLDHGDLLVVDGLAQSEHAHRTVSRLQGPRENLAFRWVTQHAASCPLAGVVGCVLSSCVQGLAEPGSRRLGE